MSEPSPILVASDSSGDAELVGALLRDHFDGVVTSADADRAVKDFDDIGPRVVILAFNTLEKAERYYLGLYRLSRTIHEWPHRTVVLCSQVDLERAYDLCKRHYFDDYVLFWPMPHDAFRLPMAVVHAQASIAAPPAGAADSELLQHALRLVDSDAELDRKLEQADEHISSADQALLEAEHGIAEALDAWPRATPPLQSGADLQNRIEAFKAGDLRQGFKTAKAGVTSLRQWNDSVQDDLARRRDLMTSLRSLVGQDRPLVLFVDDDPFQHKLLQKILDPADVDLVCVKSSKEALRVLGRQRPDMILMDVNLPDLDGVELTRRIKTKEAFADVPIIMVTGSGQKDVVVRSRQAGASGFVVKPFERHMLLQKMAECLDVR